MSVRESVCISHACVHVKGFWDASCHTNDGDKAQVSQMCVVVCGRYPTAIIVDTHLCVSVFMRVTVSERLCVCIIDVLM